jgi:hypothetical protein
LKLLRLLPLNFGAEQHHAMPAETRKKALVLPPPFLVLNRCWFSAELPLHFLKYS